MKPSKVIVGALAVAGLVLGACNKEKTETVYAPTLAVSTSAIVAARAGGSYSFTYTVANPADDGTLSYETSASWISDLSDAGSTISFNVSENDSDVSRTGLITLSYKSSYGTETASVTVDQDAGAAPTLSVEPSTVTAEIDGGSYSFSYTVTDPAADGELSCSTTADWITDFDYTTSGEVGFTVAANETDEIRSADISVHYDSSYGTLEETVTVVQDHPADSGVDVSDIIGTYTAHGTVIGNGIAEQTSMDWTVRIYAYTGTAGYDVWIDGLVPQLEGSYDYLGSHTYSAYATYDGSTISIPSQTTGTIIETDSGTAFYCGYTPCVGITDTGGYRRNTNYPDLQFTLSGSTWKANYGVFLAGCMSNAITTMLAYFQVVCPPEIEEFTLTKTADTTSLPAGENKVTHFLSDGLTLYSNFYAE